MKKGILIFLSIVLMLVPFVAKADGVSPNCGHSLGELITVNVSDTITKEFYVLGDTEALVDQNAQDASIIRLITKDYYYAATTYEAAYGSIESDTEDWTNVRNIGMLTQYDIDYYFQNNALRTNIIGVSSTNFLKAVSDSQYWTEVTPEDNLDEQLVVKDDGTIENLDSSSDAATRLVIEMSCSDIAPHGAENANTGDLDIYLYIGAGILLLTLAKYSYKKAR